MEKLKVGVWTLKNFLKNCMLDFEHGCNSTRDRMPFKTFAFIPPTHIG